MEQKLQVARVCKRDYYCLNFRRSGPTFCTHCGVRINMNHFHDSVNSIRLCDRCFQANFEALIDGDFSSSVTGPEPCECANFDRCVAPEPFGLYVAKLCDRCQQFPPPQHYHDVDRNIRLCLQCYALGREPDMSRSYESISSQSDS